MDQADTNRIIFQEKLTSIKTSLLFVFLSFSFGALFLRQIGSVMYGLLSSIFLILCFIFFFYVLYYFNLKITLYENHLNLNFGIFQWKINLNNISECRLDEIPPFFRYGGAGIHFMMQWGIYRISLNFLEFPRVIIVLKHKKGLVQAVSFSTRIPSEWIRVIRDKTP